jgi:hypothetical protein
MGRQGEAARRPDRGAAVASGDRAIAAEISGRNSWLFSARKKRDKRDRNLWSLDAGERCRR